MSVTWGDAFAIAPAAQDSILRQVWPWAWFGWYFPDLYTFSDVRGVSAPEGTGSDPFGIALGLASPVPLGIFGRTRLIFRSAAASPLVRTFGVFGWPILVSKPITWRSAHFYVPLEHVRFELLIKDSLALVRNLT